MSENRLRFSVVIPLRDEESSVTSLLESIGRQSRPPDEVIVVDAGSRDRTAELVQGFAAPFPMALLQVGPLFPGSARNRGAERARGDWLAFTDGGVQLHSDWLSHLAARAEVGDVDVIYGSYEPVCDSFLRECAALAYVPARDADGFRGPFVASSAVRRAVFLAVGGFPDFRAAEDLVFFERLAEGGARVAVETRAQVLWQTAGSIAATFRRFALYSDHNLRAGRAWQWHRALARQAFAVLALFMAAVLAGAGPWALVLIPGWTFARTLKAASFKRHSLAFSVFHPGRLLGAAGLLAVIDAATVTGWLRFVARRRV